MKLDKKINLYAQLNKKIDVDTNKITDYEEKLKQFIEQSNTYDHTRKNN